MGKLMPLASDREKVSSTENEAASPPRYESVLKLFMALKPHVCKSVNIVTSKSNNLNTRRSTVED